jgi:hypothetical protein
VAYPALRAELSVLPITAETLSQALKKGIYDVELHIAQYFSSLDGFDLGLLHYLLTMHNGRIMDKEFRDKVIGRGIAISGDKLGIVCEKFITDYFYENHGNQDTRDVALVQYNGQRFDALAECAVALQLLRFHGSLKLLMQHWQVEDLPTSVLRVLDDFNLNLKVTRAWFLI